MAQFDSALSLLPLHEWACLRTELIWIYDRAVDPAMHHWKGPSGDIPGYRLWLIRSGSVTIKTQTRNFHIGPGKWVSPVKQSKEVFFSKDARLLSIHFLCHWPSGENILVRKEGASFPSEKYPVLERMAKRLHRHLQKQFPDKGASEHMYGRKASSYADFFNFQSLFLRWIAVWMQIEIENGATLTRLTSGDDRPFQAARYLNQAALDGGFPSEALQRESGLGLMRLNQLFISQFGLTTRKYWDRRRLEFAKQCLETSRMPMKEIACRLGFRSDSHFVIWFRRLAGERPGDYRKHYANRALP